MLEYSSGGIISGFQVSNNIPDYAHLIEDGLYCTDPLTARYKAGRIQIYIREVHPHFNITMFRAAVRAIDLSSPPQGWNYTGLSRLKSSIVDEAVVLPFIRKTTRALAEI